MEQAVDGHVIIRFWFKDIEPEQWWVKDVGFDRLIRERFFTHHRRVAAGECHAWRETPLGRLAEIIVLDQFSRNLYRDSGQAFSWDGQALVLAQEAIRLKVDQALSSVEKAFLYMPFMHSESSRIHEWAVSLFNQPGLQANLEFEYRHKAIIDRFGRYPHRNEVLGRLSTPEEITFLQTPGSSF